MKFIFLILSSVFLTVGTLIPLVESSNGFNITRGSSLSTSANNESNSTSYWLSPSGNIAFGFYPLCPECHRYVVGIWLFKSSEKTLVWTANRNDAPLGHPSSILFNKDGRFVLRTIGGKQKSLFVDVLEPVSYAKMHDNGNFVLYGTNSTIVWESFDYPTDTILGGQTLKSGHSLISSFSQFDLSYGNYVLRIEQKKGDLAIYEVIGTEYVLKIQQGKGDLATAYCVLSDCERHSRREVVTPMSLNLEPTTGRLSLVDWDNSVFKNITNGEIHLPRAKQDYDESNNIDTNVIYRATLGRDGIFRLYKERINGCDCGKSTLLWDSRRTDIWAIIVYVVLGLLLVPPIIFMGIIFLYDPYGKKREGTVAQNVVPVDIAKPLLSDSS